MAFFRPAVVAFAVAGVLLPTPFISGTPARAQAKPQDDVRGLWVVRSSLSSPARVDELVRMAVDGGYNTLMVQVRGRGDAYYHSTVDPRADELRGQPQTFDPLERVLSRAHAVGLKVHGWFNVNLVSNASGLPTDPAHVVNRHPEWLMVPRHIAAAQARLDPRSSAYTAQLARWTRSRSDTVEGLFLSPVTEGAQDYTLAVVRDLLSRYALDGLHLDYVRYPTEDFDYSAETLRAFRDDRLPSTSDAERERLDRLTSTDLQAWTNAYPEQWRTFRLVRLTTLVNRIKLELTKARPDALLSAAVLPEPDDARQRKLQDWATWAAQGVLDVVCPMAYSTSEVEFARQVAAARAGAGDRPVWAGIGAWRLPVSRAADHIRTAREQSVEGVLLFSYDSLLTAASPRGAYFMRLRSALLAINDRP